MLLVSFSPSERAMLITWSPVFSSISEKCLIFKSVIYWYMVCPVTLLKRLSSSLRDSATSAVTSFTEIFFW